MKERKQTILIWIVALLPLAMAATAWARLPEQVPIRWGFNGEVDEYGSRWMLLFFAAINPAVVLLMQVLPKIDPRKDNYPKFRASYHVFQLTFTLFMDGVLLAMLAETLRPGTVHIGVVIQMLAAILMIVIGNMMPKFRQTYFCGFKTPWTLSSERVWTKTHRLGGRMYFGAGIVVLLGAFLPAKLSFAVLFLAVLTAAIVPTVMSYVWFRQEQSGSH